MSKLFSVIVMTSYLLMSGISFAGIDYIQYQENFKEQETSTPQLQHKSKAIRDADIQTPSSSTTSKKSDCNCNSYHHKKVRSAATCRK